MMKDLERKLEETNKEYHYLLQENDSFRRQLAVVEADRNKGKAVNEELEYQLRLKENEATFLNESLQKANQDITISIAENKKLEI